jgi:soluble lytic murein transglycosylase-like protein
VRIGRGLLAAMLVATGLALPAGPALGADTARPAAGDLAGARDELADASRELSDLRSLVRRTGDEVAALDERLRSATTTLAALRSELTAAAEALATAEADERAATDRLVAADDELASLLGSWDAHRDRLSERAVQVFKHGSTSAQEVLVRGVAGAGDWHEVAITLTTVERLAAEDRALIDDSAALTRRTAHARSAVAGARTDAIEATRLAGVERRRVEELTARQAATVADIESQHTRRAAVLAGLETDATARAVLVRELEERVAAFERAEREARLARERAAAEAARRAREIAVTAVDLDELGPPPGWATGLPAAGQRWSPAIEAAAGRYGLDPRLFAALVWTESNFHPGVVSHAGALGLAQLMPGTARGLGVDPLDPLQNLDGGARYLRAQLDTFGRVDLALAAYNAGPGRVRGAGNAVPNIVETQLYVVRVLDRYEALAG